MKFKATYVVVAAVFLAAGSAFAQAAAPAPESTLSYNIGATTDYRYRGISQSGKKPAINGGIDYAPAAASTWAPGLRRSPG